VTPQRGKSGGVVVVTETGRTSAAQQTSQKPRIRAIAGYIRGTPKRLWRAIGGQFTPECSIQICHRRGMACPGGSRAVRWPQKKCKRPARRWSLPGRYPMKIQDNYRHKRPQECREFAPARRWHSGGAPCITLCGTPLAASTAPPIHFLSRMLAPRDFVKSMISVASCRTHSGSNSSL
jgi:hypothetical protein